MVAQSGDPQDRRPDQEKPELKIWLDIGTKESHRALPDARELEITLVKKGWVHGEDLAYMEAERRA